MTSDRVGERDLNTLLSSMEPRLEAGEWVFVTVEEIPDGTTPLASFVEREGQSLVIRRDEADGAGLDYDFIAAWISLTVHSALDAVGLTAAIAGQLAGAGISCNVIAARHHDHVFVLSSDADRALGLIQQLSVSAKAQ